MNAITSSTTTYYSIQFDGNLTYCHNRDRCFYSHRIYEVYTDNLFLAKEFYQSVEQNNTLFADCISATTFQKSDELTIWNSSMDLEYDRLMVYSSKVNSNLQLITSPSIRDMYVQDWIRRCGEPLFRCNPDEFWSFIYPFIVEGHSMKRKLSKAINTIMMTLDDCPESISGLYHWMFEALLCCGRLDFVSLFYEFDRR